MNNLKQQFKFPNTKPNIQINLKGKIDDGTVAILHKYLTDDIKVIVEFGSFLGLTTNYLLKKTDSNCIIISVDDWLGDWGSDDSDDTDGDDVLYNTFIANTWNNKNRVIPIKMPNLETIELLVKLKIQPDIIFVNKRQNYESVYNELELLIKHFDKSIIIGNNIMNIKSVSQAVKDLIKDYDLSNVETNLNSYVIVPQWYTDKFQLKELKIKTIKPLNQYNPSKVAIIVGFKKELHSKFVLTRFLDYMKKFMDKTQLEYEIFVIHQTTKSGEYNLGKLYNSGYEIAENAGCGKFIFHDINLLPADNMIPYYKLDIKEPLQLGYNWEGFSYEVFYLGTMLFDKTNFTQINGYPNNIIGWSGWDHEVVQRLKTNSVTLGVPDKGDLIPNGDKPSLQYKHWKNVLQNDIIQEHSKTWNENGLNNTFYNLMNAGKLNNNCKIYTLDLVDEKYYLGSLEPIVQEIGDVNDDNSKIEIEFKFGTEMPQPQQQFGYIKEDAELNDKYFYIIGKYKDLLSVMEPFNLLQNIFSFTKWNTIFKTKYNIPVIKNNDNIDYYYYDIIKHISNNFNHIKSSSKGNPKVLNFLQINPIDLNNVDKFNIKTDLNKYVNTFKHLLKYKLNKSDISINYRGSYSITYFNNKDVVLYPEKYKLDDKNTILNNLCTYQDFEKLIKHCKNQKFDFIYNADRFQKNFNIFDIKNKNVWNIINILELYYKVVLVLYFSQNNSSCIISTSNLTYFKPIIDIIYILKKYFKIVKIVKTSFISNNKGTSLIICDNFKGISQSELNQYINILKKNYTDSLFQDIIKNNNLYKYIINDLIPTKQYITNYDFINSISKYSTNRIIHKYDYYSRLIYISKLKQKDINELIKKLYKHKYQIYLNYLKINHFK